jgi:uncharacterized protein YabE (DUF348 family)
MVLRKKRKNKKKILLVALLLGGIFFAFQYFDKRNDVLENNVVKNITLNDDGFIFDIKSSALTVDNFIAEQKINVSDQDLVFPTRENVLYGGANVIIQRANKIIVTEGGNTQELYAFQDTVEGSLWENNVSLGGDDFTKPDRKSGITDGMKIVVTHVQINEDIKNEPIDFKTVTNEDDELGWRIKKTTQKGEKGIMEVKYKIVLYDGKEISRKVVEKNKTKDPIDEIITQGTYVKIGKVHTGVASWYAWTGTLAAANPWLPMGSYVRVTNKDNGKSVMVKINDRGPFGNGRIIDLDKVAFEKIASLGQGTANIKMEVVVN